MFEKMVRCGSAKGGSWVEVGEDALRWKEEPKVLEQVCIQR